MEPRANQAWLQALSGYCRGEPIVFPFQGSRPVLANSDPGNYNFHFYRRWEGFREAMGSSWVGGTLGTGHKAPGIWPLQRKPIGISPTGKVAFRCCSYWFHISEVGAGKLCAWEYMCVYELLKITVLNPPKKISILSCVFLGLTEKINK